LAVSYQLVIDCTSPEPLALFWAEALRYVIAPPPPSFDSWDDFYRSIGVPEDELGRGTDVIEDPKGEGPRIWFQIVPEKKSIKNRIHIDVNASGGRSGAPRVSRCYAAAHDRRGWPRPLRSRDDRSRRQRVRHQLVGDLARVFGRGIRPCSLKRSIYRVRNGSAGTSACGTQAIHLRH
jgi:Glyoxalase-like domain